VWCIELFPLGAAFYSTGIPALPRRNIANCKRNFFLF